MIIVSDTGPIIALSKVGYINLLKEVGKEVRISPVVHRELLGKIGIESEYYGRIFGIFKRLYSREKYSGTGVGLAMCKRIVETHGGRIWVNSDKKNGTYMYFTISKSTTTPKWII